jgi:dihydrofolate reductase
MRKIIVQEFITLDGVMQAPGGSDEDKENGFKYGGWTAPFFRGADDESGEFMKRWMQSTDILLGRITFDLFADYWPKHAEMWPGIQDVNKYVMSNTLRENKTDWHNVTFIKTVDDLKKLKNSEGGDIKIHGSGNLAQTLFKHDLVDELVLMMFPITLGNGKKLFGEGTIPAAYKMTDSLVTSNGVIFGYYKRAEKSKQVMWDSNIGTPSDTTLRHFYVTLKM